MMTKSLTLLFTLCCACAGFAQTPQPASSTPPAESAQAAAAFEAAHLAAVEKMLAVLRVGELTIVGMQQARPKASMEQEFVSYMMARLTAGEVEKILAPAYAAHVPLEEAHKLAALFAAPAVQNGIDHQIKVYKLGRDKVAPLNPRDAAAMRTFERSAEGRRIAALPGKTAPQVTQAMGKWMARFHNQLYFDGVQAIGVNLQAALRADPGKEPALFIPPPSGLSYVDAMMNVVARSAHRNTVLTLRLNREIEALKMGGFASPANLIDPARMAPSRTVLDQAERTIEDFITRLDASIAQFTTEAEAIDMPGKNEFKRGMQVGLEKHMNWAVRFSENQRSTIDILRRILSFVESRKGAVKLDDGVLVFRKDADSAAFNGLIEELNREIGNNDTLVAESEGRVDNVVKGKF